MEIEKIYTLQEISDITGISHRTLKSEVYGGKITAHKIAGKWRITETDLKAYLDAAPTNKKENKNNDNNGERSTILSDTSSTGNRSKRGSRRKTESSV